MTVPVILRLQAEADVRAIRDDLEQARVGLSQQFTDSLREVLERIESQPEMYGIVWRDVRAVRLRKSRYLVYYIALTDRVEVLAVMHGSRDATAWQSRA
jgi:toxin ParE1/3/4